MGTIFVLAGGRLVSDGFNTEQPYDVLTIDGTDYSGNDVDVNVRVDPNATIKWTSDGSGVRSGWKICFVESGVYDATTTDASNTDSTTTAVVVDTTTAVVADTTTAVVADPPSITSYPPSITSYPPSITTTASESSTGSTG